MEEIEKLFGRFQRIDRRPRLMRTTKTKEAHWQLLVAFLFYCAGVRKALMAWQLHVSVVIKMKPVWLRLAPQVIEGPPARLVAFAYAPGD